MNPLIRISFALLLVTLATATGFAGTGALKPVNRLSSPAAGFRNSFEIIHAVDSFLAVPLQVSAMPADRGASETASARGRICSCQILNLSSSNYDHRHMALLAEKTNHGSSSDFSAAKNRIEKEKKQLKRQFFDKVKVVSSVTEVGSCHALYVQLKSADSQLQVYEILNADIR